MKHFIFVVAFIAIAGINTLQGQNIFAGYEKFFTQPRQYIACQTTGAISIDGHLDEAAWKAVPWSDYFTDIEGDAKPAPPFNTRFKLLWDSQYVYIAAEIDEPDIRATLRKHDDIIYHDNDFEIFIDPDGDTHNYFEVEVNPYNAIFDLFLSRPYRSGGVALVNWDVQDLRSAVAVNGTLNNPKDTDKKWTVEMAIPFQSISLGDFVQVPKDKSVWRINFSRVEWDVKVTDGAYVKKTDSITHRFLPEHNWVWSPQGAINMHMPERWGYLYFSTGKAATSTIVLLLPVAEEMKKYLWLVFYKQQAYRRQNGLYATTLSQINIPSLIDVSALNCSISLEATSGQFEAVIQSAQGNEKWKINQEGKIIKF